MMSGRLPELLVWTAHHGIHIDESLRLVDQPISGIAVYSEDRDSQTIPVTIPKSALLSVRSCSLAPDIPFAPVGHQAELSLSLALYGEMLQGSDSIWHGYLQSLPAIVPVALLWGVQDAYPTSVDDEEARQWISGSEVERELSSYDGASLLDEIRGYYFSIGRPLLARHGLSNSVAGFLHAYALVSSRAFLVDAYHGLCMVPIADAFNHANENHVHLESDYDVCSTCGALDECLHDREDKTAETLALAPARSTCTDDTCDMVLDRPLAHGEEVFNSYGSGLGNAMLLARYGFVLEGNEHDVLTWAPDALDAELSHIVAGRDSRLFHGAWLLALEDSALVYSPDVREDGVRDMRRELCVNSDAQVSVRLWFRLFLYAAAAGPAAETEGGSGQLEGDRLVRLTRAVVREQLRVERLISGDEEDSGAGMVHGDENTPRHVLQRISRLMRKLCASRISRLGKHPEMGPAAWGHLLDSLPVERTKTRLAVSQILAERTILESCSAAWEEVELTLVDFA